MAAGNTIGMNCSFTTKAVAMPCQQFYLAIDLNTFSHISRQNMAPRHFLIPFLSHLFGKRVWDVTFVWVVFSRVYDLDFAFCFWIDFVILECILYPIYNLIQLFLLNNGSCQKDKKYIQLTAFYSWHFSFSVGINSLFLLYSKGLD